MFTRLSVQLPGDLSLDLLVSYRNWLRILRGERLTIRGKGYHREALCFYDHWSFRSGVDGLLTVHTAQRDIGAETTLAYVGTPREALDPLHADPIPNSFAGHTREVP